MEMRLIMVYIPIMNAAYPSLRLGSAHCSAFSAKTVNRRLPSELFRGALRILLSVSALLLLVACATTTPQAQRDEPLSPLPSLLDQTPPDTFSAQARSGVGWARISQTMPQADARKLAFAAALADALAIVARPDPGRAVTSGVLSETLSGRAGDFNVWRQRASCGSLPLSDVILVEHSGSYLITVSGRLERLDPGFPLPDWHDPKTDIAGLRVAKATFVPEPEGLRCNLLLSPAGTRPMEPIDSLIVDARDCPFKPDRVLRLLDQDGAVLYAPEMVAADVIMRRGMAGITTTPEKAETLLRAMGGHRALTLRCLRTGTNGALVVSREGAMAARQANAEKRIFSNARVVVLVRASN